MFARITPTTPPHSARAGRGTGESPTSSRAPPGRVGVRFPLSRCRERVFLSKAWTGASAPPPGPSRAGGQRVKGLLSRPARCPPGYPGGRGRYLWRRSGGLSHVETENRAPAASSAVARAGGRAIARGPRLARDLRPAGGSDARYRRLCGSGPRRVTNCAPRIRSSGPQTPAETDPPPRPRAVLVHHRAPEGPHPP